MPSLRIGFVTALSGPQAIVGRPMLEVAQLALRDHRPSGIAVELKICDDAADETRAGRIAESLAADESVVAVVGHKNSGPSGVAGAIYHAARLPQLTPSSTDSSLSRRGWDTFFRLCADNRRQAQVAASFAAGRLGVGRPATVHDGTAYGRPLVHSFTSELRSLGVETIAELEIEPGGRGLGAVVSALYRADPDLIYVGATEIEASQLAVALRRAGLSCRLMTAEGGPNNPFSRLAQEAAEGSIHTYAGCDCTASEVGRQLDRRLPDGLPSFGAECYDAVRLVLAALEAGARTRDEIRRAVAETDLLGVSGRIHFRPDGERDPAPVSLWVVESGRPRRVTGQTLVS